MVLRNNTENISYLIFVNHRKRVFMPGDNMVTVFTHICKGKEKNKCIAIVLCTTYWDYSVLQLEQVCIVLINALYHATTLNVAPEMSFKKNYGLNLRSYVTISSPSSSSMALLLINTKSLWWQFTQPR